MAMTLHAVCSDPAFGHIESDEQGRRPVTLVSMGQGRALARLPWQPGPGAIEGLDLALPVDREHVRVGHWLHGETDDILALFGEGEIGGALEGEDTVRLRAVRLPAALHCLQADTNGARHGLGRSSASPRWAVGHRSTPAFSRRWSRVRAARRADRFYRKVGGLHPLRSLHLCESCVCVSAFATLNT